MADLGVEADHLGVVELGDQRDRVPDRRQQDVAARLVRLRLEREPHRVALLRDVGADDVERVAEPVHGGRDVLAAAVLGALAAAPHHERLGAEQAARSMLRSTLASA